MLKPDFSESNEIIYTAAKIIETSCMPLKKIKKYKPENSKLGK